MKKPKPDCPVCVTDADFKNWVAEVVDRHSIAGVKETIYRNRIEGAIDAARNGDLRFLVRLYPRLREFLVAPKPPGLKKGETAASRRRYLDNTTETAIMIAEVRRAWAKHRKDESVQHRKLSEADTIEWFAKETGSSKKLVKSKLHNVTRRRPQ